MKQRWMPIIDNGHGKDTPGKRSPKWADGRQLFEYEFNRDIASRLCKKLDAAGIEYRVLVPEDWDVSLPVRCRRANVISDNAGGGAFLVSIHANAGGGTGFEVYTTKGETKSDAMARVFFEEAQKSFPEQKMRADYSDGDPDKESQFYILLHTSAPAVLTENLFMDNEDDCRLLMSDEGRERIAEYHFKAIRRICNE